MLNFWRELGRAVRRWPVYAALAALGLLAFAVSGRLGYRLLGDDNETSAAEQAGPPRSGGHGGRYVRFYHK